MQARAKPGQPVRSNFKGLGRPAIGGPNKRRYQPGSQKFSMPIRLSRTTDWPRLYIPYARARERESHGTLNSTGNKQMYNRVQSRLMTASHRSTSSGTGTML